MAKGKTLWEMLVASVQGPAESHVYNPLKAKVGSSFLVNEIDWKDYNFFVKEIRDNARSVSPNIVVIPEIYPGIEEEATRVGSDVYEMYPVVDVIAHEYEFGDGDHMASERSILNWFLYQAGMLTFRAFAQGKATWILNYSWDGDKGVDALPAVGKIRVRQSWPRDGSCGPRRRVSYGT